MLLADLKAHVDESKKPGAESAGFFQLDVHQISELIDLVERVKDLETRIVALEKP